MRRVAQRFVRTEAEIPEANEALEQYLVDAVRERLREMTEYVTREDGVEFVERGICGKVVLGEEDRLT